MPFNLEYDQARKNLHALFCERYSIPTSARDIGDLFDTLALDDAASLAAHHCYLPLNANTNSEMRKVLEGIYEFYETLLPFFPKIDHYEFGLFLHRAYLRDVSGWMRLSRLEEARVLAAGARAFGHLAARLGLHEESWGMSLLIQGADTSDYFLKPVSPSMSRVDDFGYVAEGIETFPGNPEYVPLCLYNQASEQELLDYMASCFTTICHPDQQKTRRLHCLYTSLEKDLTLGQSRFARGA